MKTIVIRALNSCAIQPRYSLCLLSIIIIFVGCSIAPKFPVNAKLSGERINTTVDSEIAKYYLENYLQGKRSQSMYDEKIDLLYRSKDVIAPTREDLKKVAADYSVDFAAMYLADRILGDNRNRDLLTTFQKFIIEEEIQTTSQSLNYSSYLILFMPGWDYVNHGHITGADFRTPRDLVTALGVENYLVEIPPNGSVEENAEILSKEINKRGQLGKKIIVVSASSAGPAVHLSLGEQLTQDQHQSVKAWVNLGGILLGSPLVDLYQAWPRRWLFNAMVWFKGLDRSNILSMSAASCRERVQRLALPDDLLVVNYVGLSLSGQLSKFSRSTYPLLASQGPNDGLTLLADVILPGSRTIVAVSSDHYFAEDPMIDVKTVALAKTVISYLDQILLSVADNDNVRDGENVH